MSEKISIDAISLFRLKDELTSEYMQDKQSPVIVGALFIQ
jgi:hypothetical protein